MSAKETFRRIFLGNAALLAALLLVIEITGQAWAWFHPSYEVLWLYPDRTVGWKIAPNEKWLWAGHDLYAREFSVPAESNALGFRDREHAIEKPAGTVRVALLGDSFVEALQVPFEKTAGALLEKKLNQSANEPVRYEVLNFGVSSYAVGQYLLAWEEYAFRFSPDYVFVFLFKRPFERTVTRYETGAFPRTRNKELWIRPTFRLEEGKLIREPARDYAEFKAIHEELLRKEFGGKGIMRRRHGFFLAPYAGDLRAICVRIIQSLRGGLKGRRSPDAGVPSGVRASASFGVLPRNDLRAITAEKPLDEGLVPINLKVIEVLNQEVRARGGKLILVDIFPYLNPELGAISDRLKSLAENQGIGYVPLGEHLIEAERGGLRVRWRHDPHFNETGNEISAGAMEEWLRHVEI